MITFSGQGLTRRQKIAAASTLACQPCCGSGSGGSEVCCDCFPMNFLDDGGHQIWPDLTCTIIAPTMPSSPLTLPLTAGPFNSPTEAIFLDCGEANNIRPVFRGRVFSLEENPELEVTFRPCPLGHPLALGPKTYHYYLEVNIICIKCPGTTDYYGDGSCGSFTPVDAFTWGVQFNWIDQDSGDRDIFVGKRDLNPPFGNFISLYLPLRITSCSPFQGEARGPVVCYDPSSYNNRCDQCCGFAVPGGETIIGGIYCNECLTSSYENMGDEVRVIVSE